MGLGKRLSDWSAASDAIEQDRDAQLRDVGGGRPLTVVGVLTTVLKVLAPAVAAAGTWGGVVIGRSVEGWSRPLGMAAPGWMVILGALVSALVLFALAAGLSCLDQMRSQARR